MSEKQSVACRDASIAVSDCIYCSFLFSFLFFSSPLNYVCMYV